MKLAFDREVLYSSVFAIEWHPSWIRLNYVRSLNFHKKPQRDFVFHFFKNFIIPYFFIFFLLFYFFSARRCARNCVLAYRELRAWQVSIKISISYDVAQPLFFCLVFCRKKSLKIPKGQSESVYRRRTHKTMAKINSTKGQTTINKNIHKKINAVKSHFLMTQNVKTSV